MTAFLDKYKNTNKYITEDLIELKKKQLDLLGRQIECQEIINELTTSTIERKWVVEWLIKPNKDLMNRTYVHRKRLELTGTGMDIINKINELDKTKEYNDFQLTYLSYVKGINQIGFILKLN